MIMSLIEQGQIGPVKKLLSTSSPTHGADIIMLLHASINTMNLEIMRYCLTHTNQTENPLSSAIKCR